MNPDNNSTDALLLNNTQLGRFREEVLEGLNSTPKSLQSKYFYDKQGDLLFQQIMASPEYYLTDCELEVFQVQTAELAKVITADNTPFDLIELGAGDATKSQHLISYLADQKTSFSYMPIGISGNILSVLEVRLKSEIQGLNITCLEGEYFKMLSKAAELTPRRKVVMFLGANIGNMEPKEAEFFCKEIREHLKPGDLVLMGFDLKKHPKVIWDAYNDKAGITSQFNLNLLERINRELEGSFDLGCFEHYQTYDPGTGACKSYLVSLKDQTVSIGNCPIEFTSGETVFMEISQKYTLEETENLAEITGFVPAFHFLDSKGWFLDTCWVAI